MNSMENKNIDDLPEPIDTSKCTNKKSCQQILHELRYGEFSFDELRKRIIDEVNLPDYYMEGSVVEDILKILDDYEKELTQDK